MTTQGLQEPLQINIWPKPLDRRSIGQGFSCDCAWVMLARPRGAQHWIDRDLLARCRLSMRVHLAHNLARQTAGSDKIQRAPSLQAAWAQSLESIHGRTRS